MATKDSEALKEYRKTVGNYIADRSLDGTICYDGGRKAMAALRIPSDVLDNDTLVVGNLTMSLPEGSVLESQKELVSTIKAVLEQAGMQKVKVEIQRMTRRRESFQEGRRH